MPTLYRSRVKKYDTDCGQSVARQTNRRTYNQTLNDMFPTVRPWDINQQQYTTKTYFEVDDFRSAKKARGLSI